jgi:hypothetical protein
LLSGRISGFRCIPGLRCRSAIASF